MIISEIRVLKTTFYDEQCLSLIHPTYFPSISHYVAMLQADSVTFEMEDNFQKTNQQK